MAGWPPKRAVAFDFEIVIRDADGDPITDPAGLTAVASKDGAAQAAIAAPAVVSAGSKMVKVALTLTEATADRIAIVVSSTSTGAKDAFAIIFTETSQIRDQATPTNITAGTIATVTTLTGHTAQTGDSFARLGAPAGVSHAADILVIDNFVDELEFRLTAARAANLDNLDAAVSSRNAVTPPTVSQLDARTILAASYFDPAADAVIVGSINNDTITAAAIATDAVGSLEFATDAVNEIRDAILADSTPFNGADIAAIQAVTSVLVIKKNTAKANFPFLLVDSTDHITPKTGQTVTATRSIDGAAFGAAANAVVEVAFGVYKVALAASDLNGGTIVLRFTAASADDRVIIIVTQP